ncbi:MAG: fibronectin type III domain-containing protein, partial [Thaumarchaeota archaeon]|nr:fibronectin type III domain-containing protein [Nitrososphaerota archaeon]
MLGIGNDVKKGYFVNILAISAMLGASVIFLAGESFAQTAQVPDQPIGVTASAISPTSIILNWSPPQNNGGSPITGYHIDYRVAPNTAYTSLATLNNVTTYTHLNLVTGKTYIYR